MIELLAGLVVALTAAYFLALGGTCFVAPALARRFLLGFAGSAGAHYLELALRVAVGAAFLVQAPKMPLPALFTGFGWLLVVTSLGLLLVPWRWHRRFTEATVPQATRHLGLIGFSCVLAGVGLAAALAHAASP